MRVAPLEIMAFGLILIVVAVIINFISISSCVLIIIFVGGLLVFCNRKNMIKVVMLIYFKLGFLAFDSPWRK